MFLIDSFHVFILRFFCVIRGGGDELRFRFMAFLVLYSDEWGG